ncbi:MAG: hypothetical protein Q7R49_06445 [Candidatus Daviesbacteria bacterium]|nr:hypothetical protein [Candidatus Daviesbacteria bacterium]
MNRLVLNLPGGSTTVNIPDPQNKFHDTGEFITGLYSVVFLVATFVALYWLVWGIFEYIFASGDKQKLASARSKLTWAIIGLIFVLLAFLIAQFAAQILLPAGSNQPFNTLPIFK